MAEFDSLYLYLLSEDTDTGIVTVESEIPNAPTAGDDGEPDNSFEVGDLVSLSGIVSGTVEYVGHYENGWVAGGGGGTASLLLSNDRYVVGDSFTPDRTDFAVCFLTGTMIATPDGERAVETLAPGDFVLTAGGEIRAICWLGRQTIRRIFADPVRNLPIRIAAGAIDDNVPHRDLYVSPDHAMLVDGVLAHAGALVNGTSITRVSDVREVFVYHHVELEDHALILAEGAPAETFVDNVTRRRFDNYAEYEALFGKEQPDLIPEHDLPRAFSARQLPVALRERLAQRAVAIDTEDMIAA